LAVASAKAAPSAGEIKESPLPGQVAFGAFGASAASAESAESEVLMIVVETTERPAGLYLKRRKASGQLALEF
jgi:hypothetical protein